MAEKLLLGTAQFLADGLMRHQHQHITVAAAFHFINGLYHPHRRKQIDFCQLVLYILFHIQAGLLIFTQNQQIFPPGQQHVGIQHQAFPELLRQNSIDQGIFTVGQRCDTLQHRFADDTLSPVFFRLGVFQPFFNGCGHFRLRFRTTNPYRIIGRMQKRHKPFCKLLHIPGNKPGIIHCRINHRKGTVLRLFPDHPGRHTVQEIGNFPQHHHGNRRPQIHIPHHVFQKRIRIPGHIAKQRQHTKDQHEQIQRRNAIGCIMEQFAHSQPFTPDGAITLLNPIKNVQIQPVQPFGAIHAVKIWQFIFVFLFPGKKPNQSLQRNPNQTHNALHQHIPCQHQHAQQICGQQIQVKQRRIGPAQPGGHPGKQRQADHKIPQLLHLFKQHTANNRISQSHPRKNALLITNFSFFVHHAGQPNQQYRHSQQYGNHQIFCFH